MSYAKNIRTAALEDISPSDLGRQILVGELHDLKRVKLVGVEHHLNSPGAIWVEEKVPDQQELVRRLIRMTPNSLVLYAPGKRVIELPSDGEVKDISPFPMVV